MRTSPPSDRLEVCVQVRSAEPSRPGGPEIDPVIDRDARCTWRRTGSVTALRDARRPSGRVAAVLHGEFDPGSGRTLAACLTHASGATNRASARGKAANG